MIKKTAPTPCGYRVLIKIDDTTIQEELEPGYKIVGNEVQTASGMHVRYLPKTSEKKGACSGTVVSLGHTAFEKFEKPWYRPGDRVFFKRYDGCNIPGDQFGEPDVEYMVINDTDIWASITKEVK
jgi:co-chaperonin GroES (HSP10)